ncbi:MAG: thiamine-phosphate kinase, partial [Endomicrobiia bacterium]
MKLSELGEYNLVKKFVKRFLPTQKNLLVPIGDDAFVAKSPEGYIAITTDSLIENIHFSLKWLKILKNRKEFFRALGYKSLAVNISDLSAMGCAKPLYCILSLGIPSYISVEDIENFYFGLKSLADRFNILICGGDTNSAERFIINVTIIGNIKKEKIIKRSGAKPGEKIFVSGNLGDSYAGLEILQSYPQKKFPKKIADYFIKKHLYPPIRIKESKEISEYATSMIDCSDGIVHSINLLCEASKVGAEIYVDKIPVSNYLKKFTLTHLLT